MRWALIAAALLAAGMGRTRAEETPIPASLDWAFPTTAEKMPFLKLPATTEFHVAGSSLVYSGQQINDMKDAVDWLPDTHPPAPDIVLHGAPERKIEACGGCHGMNGQGFLSIPNLSRLPAAYIKEQLHELAAGRRRSSDPRRPTEPEMAEMARKLSEAEIAAAADYFSSIGKRTRWVKVVETDRVPRTKPHYAGWRELAPEGGDEPIGRRVIEVAEDFPQMWAGDPLAEAIAYVPRGALKRGRELVRHAPQPCTSCHGADLKGTGAVPPLAGRDPQYLARALWDIRSGTRNGPTVALMRKTALSLTPDQMVDVTAYLASLDP